jgi:integrase
VTGPRIGELNAELPRAAFVAIRDSFEERTGAADTCLKALRALYTWGADYGYSEDSAVFTVKSGHKSKGGAVPWSVDDKAAFLAAHGPGSMARRWFYLALDTAGRIGDTHILGQSHLEANGDALYLSWQPSKKGSKPVRIPISNELRRELEFIEEGTETFLLTEYGTPFASSGSLDNKVRKWVIGAGLFTVSADADGREIIKPTRSQHGLRKARAIEVAQYGGTQYEVMSVMSHSEPKTTARYTEDVQRAHLAEVAIRRVHKAQNTKSVPPPEKRGTPLAKRPSKTNRSGGTW